MIIIENTCQSKYTKFSNWGAIQYSWNIFIIKNKIYIYKLSINILNNNMVETKSKIMGDNYHIIWRKEHYYSMRDGTYKTIQNDIRRHAS